jgi:hypothetical protein
MHPATASGCPRDRGRMISRRDRLIPVGDELASSGSAACSPRIRSRGRSRPRPGRLGLREPRNAVCIDVGRRRWPLSLPWPNQPSTPNVVETPAVCAASQGGDPPGEGGPASSAPKPTVASPLHWATLGTADRIPVGVTKAVGRAFPWGSAMASLSLRARLAVRARSRARRSSEETPLPLSGGNHTGNYPISTLSIHDGGAPSPRVGQLLGPEENSRGGSASRGGDQPASVGSQASETAE